MPGPPLQDARGPGNPDCICAVKDPSIVALISR